MQNKQFDEDYFMDVLELAKFTIEVIANTQYETEHGMIDWNRTYNAVYHSYSGPMDGQMFNEAIELIEESAENYLNNIQIPENATIH